MTIEEIKAKLENVLSAKRYKHSLRVMDTAVELAEKYGEDIEKARLAGLVHDCVRDIKGEHLLELCREYNVDVDNITKAQPELLHGPLGAEYIKSVYDVNDNEISKAIYCHTTGCENMNLLDKIIFIADYVEPGRNFPGVDEARRLAFEDIDEAMIYALDRTIKFVMDKGSLIHPDTVRARNYIIFHKNKNNKI
ncbi:MAG: bis(5'-nucleosyl)-tetraphosphatase (symmetrical) YqeK [Clostridia bacterium]|nr:bis(5'-nucleosyl)-tetraphosphatase (symmetrical) YqeK [Clostridia bacterium]